MDHLDAPERADGPGLRRVATEALAGDAVRALTLIDGLPADLRGNPECEWLRGVAGGAAGRYGDAIAVLARLARDTGRRPGDGAASWSARAAATHASVLRQVGAHGQAEVLDARALDLAGDDDVARCDALLGLAADAVGLARPDVARRRLAEARAVAEARSPAARHPHDRSDWVRTHWPRQRVRLDWVSCEVGLLQGDPAGVATAVACAGAAEAASRGVSPRHHAKSLLFLTVARSGAGGPSAVAAALALAVAAATQAEDCRALPLVWPAYLVAGRLTSDPAEAEQCRRRAAVVYRELGETLPPELRQVWYAAPVASELGLSG